MAEQHKWQSSLIVYDDAAEDKCKPMADLQTLLTNVERNGNALGHLTPRSVMDLWLTREIQAMDVLVSLKATSRDLWICGRNHPIPLRIYTPAEEKKGSTAVASDTHLLPVLLFVHGGGWTLNSIGAYDSVTRYLAQAIPALVVSVDYQLAPEHPFPAGLHDVQLVLQWMLKHAKEHGGDPSRLAIAGDSGGANIATAAALVARNTQSGPDVPPVPKCQILIHPSTDLTRLDRKSYEQFGSRHLLTTKAVEAFRAFYVPDPNEWASPLVSPFLAPNAMLQHMPPSLIIMAGCDPLRDEGKAYAEKLRDAGVTVQCLVAPGMIHGFLLFFNKRLYAKYGQAQKEVQAILDDTARVAQDMLSQ